MEKIDRDMLSIAGEFAVVTCDIVLPKIPIFFSQYFV